MISDSVKVSHNIQISDTDYYRIISRKISQMRFLKGNYKANSVIKLNAYSNKMYTGYSVLLTIHSIEHDELYSNITWHNIDVLPYSKNW